MNTQNQPYQRKKSTLPLIIIGVAVVLLVVFLSAFSPFVTVPTGHTGVVTTFGKVEDYVLGEGFHMKNPLQEVVMMDNRTQKSTNKMQAFSSDIQQVDIVCSVNYSVDRATAQNLYKNVGIGYYITVMEPRISECVKAVFTQYTAETLMEVRNSLSAQIKQMLEPEMKVYGIQIVSISIEDVDFTDAFTEAVEAKQVALQTKLKTETQQAELVSVAQSTAERDIIAANADAQKRTIIAEAEASVAKIEADAEAYTIRVQMEAQANANKLLAESLTAELIEYTHAQRWNGELPKFVGADTVLPILDGEQ